MPPVSESYTFSYSPLSGDDGAIQGMFCVVMEEPERVIGERRLRSLRLLASRLGRAILESEVLAAIAACLQENGKYPPFTLTYFLSPGGRARLACCSGISAGHPAAPEEISADASGSWPIANRR